VGFIFLTQKKGEVELYPKCTRFRKYPGQKAKGREAWSWVLMARPIFEVLQVGYRWE
jgi:hypothetical protein